MPTPLIVSLQSNDLANRPLCQHWVLLQIFYFKVLIGCAVSITRIPGGVTQPYYGVGSPSVPRMGPVLSSLAFNACLPINTWCACADLNRGPIA